MKIVLHSNRSNAKVDLVVTLLVQIAYRTVVAKVCLWHLSHVRSDRRLEEPPPSSLGTPPPPTSSEEEEST